MPDDDSYICYRGKTYDLAALEPDDAKSSRGSGTLPQAVRVGSTIRTSTCRKWLSSAKAAG